MRKDPKPAKNLKRSTAPKTGQRIFEDGSRMAKPKPAKVGRGSGKSAGYWSDTRSSPGDPGMGNRRTPPVPMPQARKRPPKNKNIST